MNKDHSDFSKHTVEPYKVPDQEYDKLDRIQTFKQECSKLLDLRKSIRNVIEKSFKLAEKQKKVTKSKTLHEYEMSKLAFEMSLKKLSIEFQMVFDRVNLQLESVNLSLLGIKNEDRVLSGTAKSEYKRISNKFFGRFPGGTLLHYASLLYY